MVFKSMRIFNGLILGSSKHKKIVKLFLPWECVKIPGFHPILFLLKPITKFHWVTQNRVDSKGAYPCRDTMKLVCICVQHYPITSVYLTNWVITSLLRCQLDVHNMTSFILLIYYFFASIIIFYQLNSDLLRSVWQNSERKLQYLSCIRTWVSWLSTGLTDKKNEFA